LRSLSCRGNFKGSLCMKKTLSFTYLWLCDTKIYPKTIFSPSTATGKFLRSIERLRNFYTTLFPMWLTTYPVAAFCPRFSFFFSLSWHKTTFVSFVWERSSRCNLLRSFQ
jgi:hypothetical protein